MSSKEKKSVTILTESQLSSRAFKDEAYEFYKELRKSQPLYPLSLGALGKGWLISRYDDAIHLLKNEKLKKNYENVFTAKEKRPALLKNEESLTKHMLNSDPRITTACELLFKKHLRIG